MGGAKVYAVFEASFNCCKILLLVGFVIFGLIIDVGGGPQGFIGGRYYHDPGAFTSFKGLASVFVTGAFSLVGQSLLVYRPVKQDIHVLLSVLLQNWFISKSLFFSLVL